MTTITQWELLGRNTQLTNAARVTLRNIQENSSLRFGERDNGIELVWDDASNLNNVRIVPEDPSSNPITYAEPIAIEFDTGGFLRYVERDTGINLDWSATPRFQWEVTGGSPGTPVRLNEAIALLNTAHGDHLIYNERPRGINLRWYADLDITRSVQPPFPPGNWLAFGGYPPVPIPNALRSPSREAAQAQVTGDARTMTLFHGEDDDELDWHLYISLAPADRRTLRNHLRDHARGAAGLTEADLDQLYCELMVLDGWQNPTFDEFFFSADLTRAFGLPRPAWDISEQAGQDQGDSQDLTGESQLTRRNARVSMQGPLVNDAEHNFTLEIHPLDSIAYALTPNGVPLNASPEDADWPTSDLIWRVGVFTNSTFHRIHNADYLEQERRVTWFLALPSEDQAPRPQGPFDPNQVLLNQVEVTAFEPGFTNRGRGAEDLDDARSTTSATYTRDGVISAEHALTERDADGRRFLRVDVRMGEPDRWGGMFLSEYRIRIRPPGGVFTDE